MSSFLGLSDLQSSLLQDPDGEIHNFLEKVLEARDDIGITCTNEGALAAFIAYAQSFPNGFLALVDTYDTLKSGVPNFLCVALVLHRIGYKPIGVREATLLSLRQQCHEIDTFGIGTHLVTCKAQPALGCVYKLVELNGEPRIKISQELGKMPIPGRKNAYRLVGGPAQPVVDILMQSTEEPPVRGEPILCLHPFDGAKRVRVIPSQVIPLHKCVWNGRLNVPLPSLMEIKVYCEGEVVSLREDHHRAVNPTPYKVSVSEELYRLLHDLWEREAPVAEVR